MTLHEQSATRATPRVPATATTPPQHGAAPARARWAWRVVALPDELDPASVIDELVAASAEDADGAAAPWAGMDVVDLVAHIVATHHRYLWDELPRLTALVDKVAGVHGSRHPELAEVARTLAALRAEVESHLAREERVLFPMIRELAGAAVLPSFHCGRLARPISVMLVEHDRVGELLAGLGTTTGGFATPADGCASFQACYQGLADLEADTHLHVHKENNLLFPAVVRLEQGLAGVARPGVATPVPSARSRA